MAPLVSVIVTVYNLERYIGQCLESLVTQRFANFEIVVVDNGSIDSSLDICRDYAGKYPDLVRLLELDQPSIMHRGHKAGIATARGIYLHIIDGDDVVRQGYLSDAAKLIEMQQPDVIIGRYSSFVEGNALPSRDVALDCEQIDHRTQDQVIAYIRSIPAYHLAFWRYIFKRERVDVARLFDSRFKENSQFPLLDALVTYRILFSGTTFALMEEPLYYYRHRVDSVSAPNEKQTLWHIQSFVEFGMLLHESKLTKEQRLFVLAKLQQELKYALGQSDLWTTDSLDRIAELLDQAQAVFLDLAGMETEASESLVRFCSKLTACPITRDVIESYFEAERIRILADVQSRNPEAVYIFPSGQFSRNVHRWLQGAGLQQLFFLDNNPDMLGRTIQGSPCCSLQTVKGLSLEQRDKILIIIATIYEQLDAILYRQCVNNGLPEERLLVC